MHNGFVRVDDEKMSKSLGNFFTVREVLPRLRPEVLRAFLLASHYRAPVNYTDDNLRQADAALQRLYLALRDVEPATAIRAGRCDARVRGGDGRRLQHARRDRRAAVGGARAQRREISGRPRAGIGRSRLRSGSSAASSGCSSASGSANGSATRVGLARQRRRPASAALDAAEIERQVAARIEARRRRNWAESDRIRDELAAAGILLEDGPDGTTWRRK